MNEVLQWTLIVVLYLCLLLDTISRIRKGA